ncbi:unnamed protein product [Boreogadus saida]
MLLNHFLRHQAIPVENINPIIFLTVEGNVVTDFCDSETQGEQTTDSESVTFPDLKPGLKYDFQIKTQLKSEGSSQPALTSAHTESRGEQTTDSDSETFPDLKPGLKYDFQIKTQLKSEGSSQPASTSAHTETKLEDFLKNLGLKKNYKEKLSLSSVLQIDKKAVTEEAAKCLSDLPWCFLKRLMMVNGTARNVKCSAGRKLQMDWWKLVGIFPVVAKTLISSMNQ